MNEIFMLGLSVKARYVIEVMNSKDVKENVEFILQLTDIKFESNLRLNINNSVIIIRLLIA